MKKGLLLFLVISFLVLQYRLWVGEANLFDVFRLQKAITAGQEGNMKLESRNQQLDKEVQALKAHPETLEDRARTELGMIKKEETFCLVVEPAR